MSNHQQLRGTGMRRFSLYLVFTVVVMVALNWVSAPLTTDQARSGIISYEFARTPEQAAKVLSSWSPQVKLRAAFSLGLDYLFMPLYAITIGLACRMASGVLSSRRWPLAFFGGWLAGGLWLAAGLDAIENIALTALMFGSQERFWPMMAFLCASIKFFLIFSGLVYTFLGLAVRLIIKEPVDSR
jgi:hypothetical protein